MRASLSGGPLFWKDDPMSYTDILIQDFYDPRFQKAFKAYFAELGNEVKDWDGLFSYMNKGEGRPTTAILRLNDQENVVGFLMYTSMRLESWFFSEELGFIREFWVAPELRKSGHGSFLLALLRSSSMKLDSERWS